MSGLLVKYPQPFVNAVLRMPVCCHSPRTGSSSRRRHWRGTGSASGIGLHTDTSRSSSPSKTLPCAHMCSNTVLRPQPVYVVVELISVVLGADNARINFDTLLLLPLLLALGLGIFERVMLDGHPQLFRARTPLLARTSQAYDTPARDTSGLATSAFCSGARSPTFTLAPCGGSTLLPTDATGRVDLPWRVGKTKRRSVQVLSARDAYAYRAWRVRVPRAPRAHARTPHVLVQCTTPQPTRKQSVLKRTRIACRCQHVRRWPSPGSQWFALPRPSSFPIATAAALYARP